MVTKRRNTKAVGFDEEEYAFLVKKAKRNSLYPRQYIMLLARKDK